MVLFFIVFSALGRRRGDPSCDEDKVHVDVKIRVFTCEANEYVRTMVLKLYELSLVWS